MATRTVTTEKNNADGFINVSIVDKAGNTHRFKVGIPLDLNRALDKAILSNPDVLATALKDGRVQMSVWVASAAKSEKIDL